MATFAGHNGSLKIATYTDGSTEVTNEVIEIRDFSLEISANLVDDTTLGDPWNSQKVSTQSWSATVNCIWDYADATGQALMEQAEKVWVELYPTGETSTHWSWEGPANVESVSISVSPENLVEATFNLRGTGALNKVVVA